MPQEPLTTPSVPSCDAPSRLRRLASMLYEGVLLFGVVFIADYIFDTLTQSHDGDALRSGRQAVAFLSIGAYFIISWHRKGQTLPMKTWHIRLLMRDGSAPGLARLMLRYVLLWPVPLLSALVVDLIVQRTGQSWAYGLLAGIPLIFFVWTWFDPQGQFLHDRLAGTRLVTRGTLRP
ncbi:MAG: RDD family protein [Castellaniella sp.]